MIYNIPKSMVDALQEASHTNLDVKGIMNWIIWGNREGRFGVNNTVNDCEFCQGEGKIEIEQSTCDESTGYNTIVEGTGRFTKCFNCNHNDYQE